jgi:hypothetical protein
MFNKSKASLCIYRLAPDSPILNHKEFDLCLIEEVPAFPYRPYICYYLSENSLYFIQDGNVHVISLKNKTTQIYDFQGQLTEIQLCD